MNDLRIGIVGCGTAARTHFGRLSAIEGVRVIGCADRDSASARSFAEMASAQSGEQVAAFVDHVELIKQGRLDAVAIFTPHLAHYRPTIDALQAGCHVFVEKPLSTNVQEAVDIVNLARARNRKAAVGHQFRLLPSLAEAKRRIAAGAIGPVRLAAAALAQPWLATHKGTENSWRFDPKISGGGILADSGDHLVDALLWTLGRTATEVAAFQSRIAPGLDVVTAAALQLGCGTPATLGLMGDSPSSLFELTFFGESGRLRATENRLIQETGAAEGEVVPLPAPIESIDGNFVSSIRGEAELCCSAEGALDTVRLLEAIGRSAATGQIVRLG